MIFNYFQLVDMQAKMKMKAQANKLVLSYMWWLLEPLLFVSLFYVVFGYILQRGGEDFFTFLVIGKIVFMWFSKSVVSASTSLIQNKGIIGQRSLPKWIFPMVNIQESSYKSIFSFFIMIVLVLTQGYSVSIFWLQLIPLSMLLYLLICGLGMFFSILVSVAKDFSNLISLFMMGLMFSSGIFWDINQIESKALVDILYLVNPMLAIITAYRDVIMHNMVVDIYKLLPTLMISIVLILGSTVALNKFNNKITRILFS